VVEVGAGLGSLTVALARAGAHVVAVELDRSLVPALEEALGPSASVRIEVADALRADWGELLDGPGPWKLVANLPYNVAVPVVLRALELEPRIERLLVMVQREVGERLAAGPGEDQYGAVSLRVAYRAVASAVRRVPRTVFWPQPNVDSVLVSMVRHPPPVRIEEERLWPVVREAFAQRRKTIRNALVRLGLDRDEALALLERCGIGASARPEELGLPEFACLAAWIPLR
jgi:16S rRNA (adenine1518-N6/adenine1519-N6)-dimethyltransferase